MIIRMKKYKTQYIWKSFNKFSIVVQKNLKIIKNIYYNSCNQTLLMKLHLTKFTTGILFLVELTSTYILYWLFNSDRVHNRSK